MEIAELKSKIFQLLKEDLEFRYAVAGLIGLDEILRRLDRHEEELVKLREDLNKLREDMIKGFERHDEELAKLREDMVKGFERHDKELARLREDMQKGFERHDKEIEKLWAEITRLREDMIKGFERHDKELARLREDMQRGFEQIHRQITALGARWGLFTESAFREGLRGVLEREFGARVEKWRVFDEKGLVYGYPCEVEVDVVVSDEKVLLIEITSHAKVSDIYVFKKKADLYYEKTGRKPSRLILVSPYVDDKAFEASIKLGVEIYTRV